MQYSHFIYHLLLVIKEKMEISMTTVKHLIREATRNYGLK